MNILILGGGGFIGGHLARYHKQMGDRVRIVDLKRHEYFKHSELCDNFMQADLRVPQVAATAFEPFDFPVNKEGFNIVYQLAADMGGAGFVFTGENDADIMHNSALININICHEAVKWRPDVLFYSSSACVYKDSCREEYAYPAMPDSEYGWEKLFSERLYLSFARNYGLNIRIARLHNIFGTHGTYKGGREKAPAALCRKVSESSDWVEVWGDGHQVRSFLYVDECIEGIHRLIESGYSQPVNIGSTEMITINDLAQMIIKMSGKSLVIKNIPGAEGVRKRNSDNRLIKEVLKWEPESRLIDGITKLYTWINDPTS